MEASQANYRQQVLLLSQYNLQAASDSAEGTRNQLMPVAWVGTCADSLYMNSATASTRRRRRKRRTRTRRRIIGGVGGGGEEGGKGQR